MSTWIVRSRGWLGQKPPLETSIFAESHDKTRELFRIELQTSDFRVVFGEMVKKYTFEDREYIMYNENDRVVVSYSG